MFPLYAEAFCVFLLETKNKRKTKNEYRVARDHTTQQQSYRPIVYFIRQLP